MAGGADLRCEQALLVLQVVAHTVLQGLAERVVPAEQDGTKGRVNVLEVSHVTWHRTRFPTV